MSVTLTLSEPVRFGDTVTLTYTPGEDPVQDLAGLDAAVLEDSAVTNNTAAALAALGSLARPTLERRRASGGGLDNLIFVQ